jgi:hypothetical protein
VDLTKLLIALLWGRYELDTVAELWIVQTNKAQILRRERLRAEITVQIYNLSHKLVVII